MLKHYSLDAKPELRFLGQKASFSGLLLDYAYLWSVSLLIAAQFQKNGIPRSSESHSEIYVYGQRLDTFLQHIRFGFLLSTRMQTHIYNIHIYTYIQYTYKPAHTHTHAHTRTRIHTCTHTHADTLTHIYTHTYTRTHSHTHTRTHIHTHIHTHTHTHSHIYTRTHVHTHTCTHAHTGP
jgi:hypothetical protein